MKKRSKMRFFVAFVLALVLTASMAVTASAATFPSTHTTYSGGTVKPLMITVSRTTERLNVYSNSGIGDQKQISTWSWTGAADQKFIVYQANDGITTLRMATEPLYAVCSSAGNAIIRYIPNVTSINTLTISKIHSEIYQDGNYAWAFDVKSGGSLTATHTQTTQRGGYLVAWQNFTGGNRQIWHVDRV